MPRAAFAALGTYVPDRVVTNDDLTRHMETTDAWIQERTGIRERRWVREGTENSDLALEATKRALDEGRVEGLGHRGDRLRLALAGSHVPGRRLLPQRQAGHPRRARARHPQPVLGLPLRASAVADAWIRTGMYRRILLVGSEIHSTGLDVSTRGRDVAVLFGDGAGAALVEATDDGRGVLSATSTPTAATPRTSRGRARLEVPPARHGRAHRGRRIYPRMEGQKVFKHAITRMPEVVARRSRRTGSSTKDLNGHRRTRRTCASTRWSSAARAAGRPGVQQHPEVRQHHRRLDPLALAEAVEARGVKRGDLVGLCAFGAGLLGRAPWYAGSAVGRGGEGPALMRPAPGERSEEEQAARASQRF